MYIWIDVNFSGIRMIRPKVFSLRPVVVWLFLARCDCVIYIFVNMKCARYRVESKLTTSQPFSFAFWGIVLWKEFDLSRWPTTKNRKKEKFKTIMRNITYVRELILSIRSWCDALVSTNNRWGLGKLIEHRSFQSWNVLCKLPQAKYTTRTAKKTNINK